MTVALSGAINQAGPGAPLVVTWQESWNGLVDSPDASVVLAVRTTNVLPATLAAAAHYSGGATYPAADPLWDSFSSTEAYQAYAGVGVSDPYNTRGAATQRVDSNFVVGRYVWVIATADQPAASTSVPVRYVGPYLIR